MFEPANLQTINIEISRIYIYKIKFHEMKQEIYQGTSKLGICHQTPARLLYPVPPDHNLKAQHPLGVMGPFVKVTDCGQRYHLENQMNFLAAAEVSVSGPGLSVGVTMGDEDEDDDDESLKVGLEKKRDSLGK